MMDTTLEQEDFEIPENLPVLTLRDVVTFPDIVIPISVGREKSLKAVDEALSGERVIFLVTQKDESIDDPTVDDLYRYGTVGAIMRMLKLPDGNMKLIVQGIKRGKIEKFNQDREFFEADISTLEEEEPTEKDMRIKALTRNVKTHFEKSVSLGGPASSETVMLVNNLEDPGKIADLVASELNLDTEEAQQILEEIDPFKRLKLINEFLQKEIELLSIQQKIDSQAKGEISKSQREYYLRQQLKAIQEELGEEGEFAGEAKKYADKLEEIDMPEEAREECERQLNRLQRMNPQSPETTNVLTYLEWMTEIPWTESTEDRLDIEQAKKTLDEDHHALEDVKERILEHLSVQRLKEDKKSPILCFVGPPGVGKTSLGKSIARTMGREFQRLSLGGVKDEAEIRGHRRTYVGALPGRIIQGIRQAGTTNPVFMLDEVDKIGSGGRGDPSAALLEVLDPEQNDSFKDNFLGVPYDLSDVMFITTANLLHPIRPAFRDRMEIIELPGYTRDEKVIIGQKYLIPRQIKENGLEDYEINFSDAAVETIINSYTREAGVRNLERKIASICRKIAKEISESEEEKKKFRVIKSSIKKHLGNPEVKKTDHLEEDEVGVATGLAVTPSGGDILFVEAAFLPGKGELTLTGHLGDTMRESAKAALSYARSRASRFGVSKDFFSKHDLHLHVPKGATPKDGPSAGITMAVAVCSSFSGKPVSKNAAMSGEITLRGNILSVGGIKEKVLAAKRAEIETVVLPAQNKNQLDEIDSKIKKGIEFILAEEVDDFLDRILLPEK